MANMFTYLDWRGDLDFNASKFCEVDNLIFSQLCYAPFEGVLLDAEDGKQSRSVKEAYETFLEVYPSGRQKKFASQQVRGTAVLEKLSESKRFQSLTLSHYASETVYDEDKQFAALTIDLGTDAIFIAYRGTDDTLVGWKEDFNMMSESHLPAQVAALSYFEEVAKEYPGKKFFLGGHSKGGNLAVYAATMCCPSLKERIIRVYNNDGPGFRRDIINCDAYKAILPKVRTIVPETSIFGMMLEHAEDYTIVRSTATGGMQHDCTSWEILGRHFIYLEHTDKKSKQIDAMVSNWIQDMDTFEIREVGDCLFQILMEAGIYTVSGMQKNPLKNAMAVLKGMGNLDDTQKKIIKRAISALLKERTHSIFVETKIPHAWDDEEL